MSIRTSIQARLDVAAHLTDGVPDHLLPELFSRMERLSAEGLPQLLHDVAAMSDDEFIEQSCRDLAIPRRDTADYPVSLVELIQSAAAQWRKLASQTTPNLNLSANADQLDARPAA